MEPMTISIVIFAASIVLYALNIWPLGVTAMLSLLTLVFTGCLEAPKALAGIGSSNAVIIVGMFVVAAGLKRTSLIDQISGGIRKITNGSYPKAYAGCILLGMIVTSLITSPMVAYAICFPIMDAICNEYGKSPSKAQFPLALVCIGACAILPFGFAISEAALFNGLLKTYEFDVVMSPVDFTIGRLPMLFILLAWAIFIAPKMMPEKPMLPIQTQGTKSADLPKLKLLPNTMGSIIFFVTVFALIFNQTIGIAPWLIVISACFLDIAFGVLSAKEAIAAMAIDIGFMFVGANGMAQALMDTGAATAVGEALSTALGGTRSGLLLCFLFFIIPFILTQFMLNQGVMNIFAPIALLASKALGANPIGLLVLICAGSLTAFMTPSATPAIPIAMAAGGYDFKSLFKMGWLIALVLTPCYIFYVYFVIHIF
ncbi:MAG: anion permease [Spirochaetaceae bacterium]|jgi:di/tricarboxylate transporter|nr:anion permease [Spirochaetaceae bacterium]